MKKNIREDIQKLFSSKTLRIKVLTSAGIISGIVTDIIVNCSKSTDFLDTILNALSQSSDITIQQDEFIYVVENARLYPISNLKENIFLDRIELLPSKIIASCPLFEEVD